MNIRREGKTVKFRLALVTLSIFALALAGCAAPSGTSQPSAQVATAAPELATAVVPTVAAAATEVATMEPATAAPAATAATMTTATVMIGKNDKLGDILTDDKGMTLYLFTKDTPNTSTCYDKCATSWPPLLSAGKPMAGAGADDSLLGTTTRTDGSMQVTYNGWPLYYFAKDQKAGDATGQDVGGVWYVLSAKGEQVETPGAAMATPAATSASTSMGASVMIGKNDKLGDILTDAKGMTLYLYTKDTKNTSNCYDKCATAWPPLLTQDKPTAGAGADDSLLGTTTRTDGSMQVTYNGWPLYYFAKDQKAGDATGQDVGSVWYVLSAKGEQVETPGAAMATPAATSASTSMGASVMIGKNDKLGDILTDAKGMTLYLYTKDTKNTSNCYDKCATAWPPLLTDGKPVAGAGADDSLLGTTTRTDGKMQVTYNGWPLYYFAKDQKAGDATGQDVGSVWYVLSAKGEEVETPGGSSAAPAAGKNVAISIKNFSFGDPITVPVGTTVVWTNDDTTAHTVTAADKSFDSGNMDQGASFSFTFTKAGTFSYVCTYHANMKGTVTVTG